MKITNFREFSVLPQGYQEDKQYHKRVRRQDAGLGTIEARGNLNVK